MISFRLCSRATTSISPSWARRPLTPGYSKASPHSRARDPPSLLSLNERAVLYPHLAAVRDELEYVEGLETSGRPLQVGARGGVHRQDVREEGNEEDGGIQDVVAALLVGDGIRVQLQQKLGGVNSGEESICDLERGGGEPRQLPVAARPRAPSQHFRIKCPR